MDTIPGFSLRHLHQLQVLNLEQYGLNITAGVELRRLAACTSLKSLATLGFNLITHAPPAGVTMPNLTRLTLAAASEWCRRDRVWALSSVFPNLRTLAIQAAGSKPPFKDVRGIAPALAGLTGLTQLSLGHPDTDGVKGGADGLVEVAVEVPQLRSLVLVGYNSPIGQGTQQQQQQQQQQQLILPDLAGFSQLTFLGFMAPSRAATRASAACLPRATLLDWLAPLRGLRKLYLEGIAAAEQEGFAEEARRLVLPVLREFSHFADNKVITLQL
jgi:hypothetical protein